MLKALKYYYLLIFLFSAFASLAQTSAIELVVKENFAIAKKNLSETTLQIKNTSDSLFVGELLIEVPKGIKSVSGTHVKVQVPAQGQIFLPIKLLKQSSAESGNKQIKFRIFDLNDKLVAQNHTTLLVEEFRSLYFSVEQQHIRLTNPYDSVRVRTNIINRGNKEQELILLYGIPDKLGTRYYTEEKHYIKPQQDTVIVFKFLPDPQLINKGYFMFSVSGLYADDRTLFGNTMVEVQNVSSVRRFVNADQLYSGNLNFENSITTSYRQINNNFHTTQILGGGNINLPMGYLRAQGNFYKSSTQDEWVASNTFLSYQLEGSKVQIGNVNEFLNRSFYGRGVSTKIKIEDENVINVGIIDNQYNLLEKTPFLSDGYAVYAVNEIGGARSNRYFKSIYSFQEDKYEQIKVNVVGGEYQEYFNNKWSVKARVLGALSDYYVKEKEAISYASDIQYTGKLADYNLTGNLYISSPYFPGDRRGIKQFNQHIRKQLKNDYSIQGRVYYSAIQPKSYTSINNLDTKIFSSEIGFTIPNKENFGIALGYQFQHESSNSYNSFVTSDLNKQFKATTHRLTEIINFRSDNKKHTALLVFDNGFANYPLEDNLKFIFRTNASYSYSWFQLTSLYQYGSFFMPEYFQAKANGKDNYRRLNVNAGINKFFFGNDLNIYTGIGYSKDYMWGETPSGLFKITQNISNRFSVFLNGMWYQYVSDYFQNSQTYNIEFGLTANFQGSQTSDKKKGSITVFVYYDNNGNSIYDDGDSPAVGYYVTLNNTSFITDLEGKFTYKGVPYGTYKMKSSSLKGWFNYGMDVEVARFRAYTEVPLQQMGSVSGKIQYLFDQKSLPDFTPKKEGITLKISQGKTFVKRIVTTGDGEFSTFLPKGDYQIEIEASSLQKDVSVKKTIQYISVTPGTIYKIPTFELEPKQRKVNVKKFGE